MRFSRRVPAVAAICCVAAGVPSAAKADQAPTGAAGQQQQSRLLFTQSAPRATFVPAKTTKGNVRKGRYILTLRAVSRQMTWFEDHPGRSAGHMPVRSFIGAWAEFGFSKNPPNAALTVLHGKRHQDTIIVELGKPRYYPKSRSLQYRARLLSSADGRLAHFEDRRDRRIPRKVKDVSLFIDDAAGQVINGCLIQAGISCPEGDHTGADQISFYPNAFASGTRVMTADGHKAIEQVTVGEQVVSIDADGTPTLAPVTFVKATGSTGHQPRMLYAWLGDQKDLLLMPDTIFAGGVRAEELRPGDSLRTVYGTDETIIFVAVGSYTGKVVGLSVGGPTGMFVAEGVLVHGWGPA